MKFLDDVDVTLYHGDVLDVLATFEESSIDAVVTSPPYVSMRPEYGSPEGDSWYDVFSELARVVRRGMVWNVGRFWRDRVEQLWWVDLIEAADAVGWQLRDTGLWIKLNANPIQGEILVNSHEYLLLFGRGKEEFNEAAIARNYAEGSVERLRRRWESSIAVKNDDHRSGARRGESREPRAAGARAPSFFVTSTGKVKGVRHPAPMALDVAYQLVALATFEKGEIVLDPFVGSGTTAIAARALGLRSVGIDESEEYLREAAERLAQQSLLATEGGS